MNTENIQAGISTEKLAAAFGVKPNTPRVALARDGHYFGLKPRKAPNGRLIWPLEEVQAVLAGGAK